MIAINQDDFAIPVENIHDGFVFGQKTRLHPA